MMCGEMLKCDKVAVVPALSAVLPAIFHHQLPNLYSLQNRLDKIPPPSREASALDCHDWHWSIQRRDDDSHGAVTDPPFNANPRWCGVDAGTHKPAPEAPVSCLTPARANNPREPSQRGAACCCAVSPDLAGSQTTWKHPHAVRCTLLYGACPGLAGAFGFCRLFHTNIAKPCMVPMNAAPGLLSMDAGGV